MSCAMDSLDSILHFANQHREDDPLTLLLQKGRYPDIDLGLVTPQLEGRRQAREKWPSLATRDDYFYPPRLNREQSSSEATARYKAGIAAQLHPDTLADLTGGMGVDLLFMAPLCHQADYFELDAGLCAITEHNFKTFGLHHISCHNTDSLAYIAEQLVRNPGLPKDPGFVLVVRPLAVKQIEQDFQAPFLCCYRVDQSWRSGSQYPLLYLVSFLNYVRFASVVVFYSSHFGLFVLFRSFLWLYRRANFHVLCLLASLGF